MSKYKIINLFDKIFITCAVFLLIFAWINFFIRNIITTFFISLVFTFAVVFLLFFLFNKKQEKKFKTKSYLKDVDEKFLAFRLMSKTEQLSLLFKILKQNHTTRIVGENLVIKKDNLTCLFIVATTTDTITEHDFINLLQGKNNVDEINIICNDFVKTINTKILNNIQVNFITKKQLYDDFFFKFSIYPDTQILNTKYPKKKPLEILKNFISKEKAKPYFLSGLILIFSSIILPYHTYYLIFGSALLILSVICKLKPLFKR